MGEQASMDILPDWLDADIWQDFIDYRKEDIKKPFTERAQRQMLRRLWAYRGQGYDPNYLLMHAMSEGWQNVHPVRMPQPGSKVESLQDKQKIKREDIERHARPGESWEEAEARLRNDLENRKSGPRKVV